LDGAEVGQNATDGCLIVVSEGVETARWDSEELKGGVSGEESGSVFEGGVGVEVPDVVAVSSVSTSGDGVNVDEGEVWTIWEG